MSMRNTEIAAVLYRLAELLEIEGANPFRVRAYRNAGRTIEAQAEDVAAMIAAGRDLTELPGIGEDLAGKIAELVETGHLRVLDETEHRLPASLVELASVPGLGPKRIKLLHDRLKVSTVAQLKQAADAGKLRAIQGLGANLEQKIVAALAQRSVGGKRITLDEAEDIGAALLDYLKAGKGVHEAVIAGSYRRRRDTVGDLDILVTADAGADVMARFVAYPEMKTMVSHGTTRSTIVLRTGLNVDLRVVEQPSFGAALHYFTGSKEHNIAIRTLGAAKGLKINEYGVFRGDKRIGGRTEAEVYKAVNLPYIEPELRENRGEIEAAAKRKLPRLVTGDDIRGDLHVHTSASDGHQSIAEMAEAARALGYAYMAITDHSKRIAITHGLDRKRLARQIAEIDRLNGRLKGIRILKGVEVDILDDGKLDLPDEILAELDLIVGAVHSKFDLPAAGQTERLIRAMDNRCFNILAHPTGRLLGSREPYGVDLERVIKAAKERGCFLEINGQPERLDLNDVHARLAKEIGVKLALTTDAHAAVQLGYMRFAVGQARRGWLEREDILNTRHWAELSRLLRRR